jgi:HPt (histidine-containing phosphotransfer) domain-containing protein
MLPLLDTDHHALLIEDLGPALLAQLIPTVRLTFADEAAAILQGENTVAAAHSLAGAAAMYGCPRLAAVARAVEAGGAPPADFEQLVNESSMALAERYLLV